MYLLDTNVLSEILRRSPDVTVTRRLHAIALSNLFSSEITRYELRYGAALRPDGEALWRRIVEEVVPLVSWLPVDERVALAAAQLRGVLRKTGHSIDVQDAFIAATALAHNLVLVTRNQRHFEHVSALTLENWFAR